ncbi:UDP-N-acetylmuramate dehydrogenase [Conexibacter woesei]|uniref:UDP-N-acetylmuramate dehydrogenase n=1 Tax=Conexibacter woesei TaxID=191495 RepID=UPI000418D3FD|nr:UDP-N-acetylmuramate dehydrogenase [Conexibacter woesei]
MLLSDHTTLRLGGPAARFVAAETDAAVIAAVAGDPDALILGGGSNLVVGDAGYDGTVVKVATRGIEREGDTLHVAAGEVWDDVVRHTIAQGLAGIECLSGIPGSTGATPIQNVGAYGQEVSDTIVSVRAYDRRGGKVVDLTPEQCGFAYRDSMFKQTPGAFVVLRVSFRLAAGPPGAIRYGELARAVGENATLAEVREAVLALRRGKGMVLDPDDHDTWSAGSFFTNPILDADAIPDGAPAFPQPDGRVKTSAAWLIDHAGFAKGFALPDSNVAISTKHVLALTNRGGGTTAQLTTLAQEIQRGVSDTYNIALVPEPVFVRT